VLLFWEKPESVLRSCTLECNKQINAAKNKIILTSAYGAKYSLIFKQTSKIWRLQKRCLGNYSADQYKIILPLVWNMSFLSSCWSNFSFISKINIEKIPTYIDNFKHMLLDFHEEDFQKFYLYFSEMFGQSFTWKPCQCPKWYVVFESEGTLISAGTK